ncbi:MAG: DUF4243 domain-containing protein [Chloroflexi bacterium]|nr:DUF4243 domain-containing protein [Chloroflexota bacterium]
MSAATIDEALELLEHTGPEFGGGLSNHGPMAAEALVVLGRDGAVIPWVERYRRRLQPEPEGRNAIDPAAWREALGHGSRVGDWAVFFERDLSEAPWQDVVGRWVPLLAPGLVAAAMHGVIRTAHAVRSLASGETPGRLKELAQGLAYWAARYQELPGAAGADGRLPPSQALREVEPVPDERRRPGGLITHGLRPLADHQPFQEVPALVSTGGDTSTFVSDLTETFANVYLASALDIGMAITFIHAVTGPSAVRLLLPYLPPEAAPRVLRYAWQAAAALYAAFGVGVQPPRREASTPDVQDLIDQAVATGDEHAIKFGEACLREYDLNPRPVYLAAIEHANGIIRR